MDACKLIDTRIAGPGVTGFNSCAVNSHNNKEIIIRPSWKLSASRITPQGQAHSAKLPLSRNLTLVILCSYVFIMSSNTSFPFDIFRTILLFVLSSLVQKEGSVLR